MNAYTPGPVISRAWAMPSPQTFSIKPIRELVLRYAEKAERIIDPFARDSELAHVTNDLNPATGAQYHLSSDEFADLLVVQGQTCDLILFDPPYSLRQVKEVYDGIGRKFSTWESQQAQRWTYTRDKLTKCLVTGGITISFGWNTSGFGKKRGFEPVEYLIVGHGPAHNDTLVAIERKL